MSRRLIVNADDLGRTVGINDGIFHAHRHGIVTSATLMVCYEASAEAAGRLFETPELGVGLHVQLSGGRPLLPPEGVPSLVDDQGLLPRRPPGLERARREDLEREVRAQLARFEELLDRAPTHLDSHHHSHALPLVCAVIAEVARERSLPVRNASPEVAAILGGLGVRTTEVFDARFYDAGATLDDLLAALDELGDGTTELMCHPGRSDDELRASSTYAQARDREVEVLCDPAVRERIAALGVELVHFGDL
ncbi:MAG TPA: carbohydrate deacetylase [Thermoanaerobaculia bacterium]|nr:carbohydrate deacetylase [Thermoanaerobaculia bacterium]